jgi:hypothetical protein
VPFVLIRLKELLSPSIACTIRVVTRTYIKIYFKAQTASRSTTNAVFDFALFGLTHCWYPSKSAGANHVHGMSRRVYDAKRSSPTEVGFSHFTKTLPSLYNNVSPVAIN